jgi:DNA-binding CsgD family transcriptional regulator
VLGVASGPTEREVFGENGTTGHLLGSRSDVLQSMGGGPFREVCADRAFAVWRGLFDGQWSLVHQCNEDDRRFILVRRNAQCTRAWQSLSVREAKVVACIAGGQAAKAVAAELGLTASTIYRDLSCVAKKLALTNRMELMTAYRNEHYEENRP